MRVLFLSLLFANILAFAYLHFGDGRPDAAAQIAALQVSPEKVKLLKAGDNKTQPQVSAKSIPVCLEWGSFSGEDVSRAAAALAKFDLKDKLTQRETGDMLYWVYIPALKTKADADKKAAQVKALGISDYSVVQDDHAWIVSLGAFKTEDNAKQQLLQVIQKGVRSAIVGQRGSHSTLFMMRDPGDAVVAQLATLKTQFPDAPLKAATCDPFPPVKN